MFAHLFHMAVFSGLCCWQRGVSFPPLKEIFSICWAGVFTVLISKAVRCGARGCT